MNGYENGKIYKVVDKNDNIIYIGSTKLKMNKRWTGHHLNCDQNKILLIENYPCESREELRIYEQKFIDLYNEMGLVNQRKAYSSEEESKQQKKDYYETDKYKESQKIYKQSEKYKQQQKEYFKEQRKIKANCPHCNKIMLKNSISRHIRVSCKDKPIDNN